MLGAVNRSDFRKIQSRTKGTRRYYGEERCSKRGFATGKQTSSQLREELAKENVKTLSDQQKARKQARALDRVSHFVNCDLDLLSNFCRTSLCQS